MASGTTIALICLALSCPASNFFTFNPPPYFFSLFIFFTGKEDGITLLQKMGIGIFLSIITMIVSGVVEDKRRTLAMTRQKLEMTQGKGAISSMSGLWLIPQMALSGKRVLQLYSYLNFSSKYKI